ncbi:COBRA-like protein 7 isoform X2 [Dendrobium catenatum]|uniref:COBRA-like protein 7 isoform X2 n=1 Tax=Dendrobium catenatum TaxID=906689 RepID=UPI0009F2805E|nr:COBRA-like protein 7 isoform X2 [Dendrobium catenatum]
MGNNMKTTNSISPSFFVSPEFLIGTRAQAFPLLSLSLSPSLFAISISLSSLKTQIIHSSNSICCSATMSLCCGGGGVLLWVATYVFLLLHLCLAGAYDPMDPNGNITIKWDFQQFRDDGYTVMIDIYNYQLYRHIDSPGWKLGWTWGGEEVIWDARGAEAAEQGNCSKFTGNIPHCCDKSPVIVDLLPGAPYNMQTKNCCKGGVLASLAQDHLNYHSSFQISVGTSSTGLSLNVSDAETPMPYNFSLGLPGYTCSNATVVPPTKFQNDGGRRKTQALLTWLVSCSYSQFRESQAPKCCVSLSTFYNETIVPCPTCSCGCQGSPEAPKCANDGQHPTFLQLPQGYDDPVPDIVMCTRHMCPIRVHWHLKLSYKEYWRVKVTINNFNMLKNYSDWTLVVQHPNLQSLTQVFSFNYKPLIQYNTINDTGVFWGIKYYNDLLLQQGEFGNVQTEILLKKDPAIFTFQGGWPFPRKISFNGQECVMPTPDEYPSLPRGSTASPPPDGHLCHGLALLVSFTVFLLIQASIN